MNFNQTDERRILQETLRRFFADKYRHEDRQKIIQSGCAYDREIYGEMAELGLLGSLFPEQCGGFGGTGFDIAVVFEEFGRAGVIEPILGSALLAGRLLFAANNSDDSTRLQLLEEVIQGRSILAFAHGEPNARYDLSCVTTTASWQSDTAIISGKKSHVLNGAEASHLLVSARESGNISDKDGIALFLLPVKTPGVTCIGNRNIDGTASASIIFDRVHLTSEHKLNISDCYSTIETATCHAILGVCAEAIGAMETSKDLTVEYLRERHQFGSPLGKFQALQHRMVDMLIEIEQARSAMINLAGNMHQPSLVRERYASAAKNLIGRVGTLVSEECIQMHGGIGMTDEYALSHFARRLVMIDHLFGDVDYHLERFIALSTLQEQS